jgi:hypothetical protein
MLQAAIKTYYAHQQHRLPGSKLVELDAYQLVHGEQKTVISPLCWLNLLAPEMVVKMSIIVHKRVDGAEHVRPMEKCPKCQSLFQRKFITGRVTWYVYSLQSFAYLIPYNSSLFCSAQFELDFPHADVIRDLEEEVISPAA